MLKHEFIPVGRENAISRKDLARLTGMSDRMVRRNIARLRTEDDGTDMIIVSTSRGRGYYRSDNIDEIQHFINEMAKRIRNIVQAIALAKLVVDRLKKKQMYGEGLG